MTEGEAEDGHGGLVGQQVRSSWLAIVLRFLKSCAHTSLESFNGLRARLETHSQWDCASWQASAKEHPACLTLLLY